MPTPNPADDTDPTDDTDNATPDDDSDPGPEPEPDIGSGPDADAGDDTDTDTDLKPEPKSGTGPGPDTATDTSGGVSTPDRGVGVTDEVYDGLLWLGDHRAEVDALDTRYPANPDAAATVLYENNRDGAAAWITAHPNQYRRGQAEGFYLRGSDDDPNNADADTDDAPTTPGTGSDPDPRPRPRGRRELIDEFLNVPEEWHATTAGFAIGYAIYTPDATLLAFALMLVGLDMATTVQWEGNEKLIREMRAEYPYAILGAVIGALLGLAHLAAVGGDAVIADFVADAADGATGASAFWGPVMLAVFGGALIATGLVMVALKLAGLLP